LAFAGDGVALVAGAVSGEQARYRRSDDLDWWYRSKIVTNEEMNSGLARYRRGRRATYLGISEAHESHSLIAFGRIASRTRCRLPKTESNGELPKSPSTQRMELS
jgi:hypothetical protein